MKAYVVAGCVLVTGLAVASAVKSQREARQSERQWVSAERAVTIWQARYAASASEVKVRVDTVRVRVQSVMAKRDTLLLHLTDTLLVKEYVQATDTALRACTDLANSCAVFRVTADSTIHALNNATSWYKAEAAYQTKRARGWKIAAAILGGVIVWKAVW